MKSVFAMAMAVLAGASCNEGTTQTPLTPTPAPPPPATAEMLPTSSPNIYSLKQADGTYDFYIGPAVKEAAEKGEPMPPGWYKLGKVKQNRVDKATGKASKVASYSLEDPANSDMEVEFSAKDNKSLKLKAGDPCLSGVVQVAIDPKSGSPTALFDVYHWVKYPNGPTAKNVYTTGVLPDDELPVVSYTGSPPPDCK